MESIRPIRALMRGVDTLAVLNLRDGATVAQIAQEIRLPRTTVYRILQTLCDTGLVVRDAADDRYRLTVLVRGLTGGFEDLPWITQIAKPAIHELCREIVWPVSIATLADGAGADTDASPCLMVRETTDHATPLAIDRNCAGWRIPLAATAPGRAYLAFASAAERGRLIDAATRAELEPALVGINAQGFATDTRTRRLIEEVSLSVPVMTHDAVLAVLTVRFLTSAVPLRFAVERFVPKMRQYAARIAASFAQQQSAVRRNGAAETAA